MDRFQELNYFVAVAESGGFAKAADRLNSSPPAVTRRISALEDRLGVQLFNRTTRSVSLTEPGLRFLNAAQQVLSNLDVAEKDAVGDSALPTGHLIVTASVNFGRMVLNPILSAFLKSYPEVRVSAVLLDRVVNLMEEGIDVAIRIAHLPNSSLIAQKVGAVRLLLVASPNYLEKYGYPKNPEDLKDHKILAFTGLMPNREWKAYLNGKVKTISLQPRYEINDAASCINAAEAGEGIAIALSYMVAELLVDNKLETVLDNYRSPEIPVQLVYPQSRLIAPKVRSFVDHATPDLKKVLAKIHIQ